MSDQIFLPNDRELTVARTAIIDIVSEVAIHKVQPTLEVLDRIVKAVVVALRWVPPDQPLTLDDGVMNRAVKLMTGMEYGLMQQVHLPVKNPDGSSVVYMNSAGARKAIGMVLQAVNEATEPNRTFRAVTRDLERLSKSDMSFDDQARDLFLSYDIRPKGPTDGASG